MGIESAGLEPAIRAHHEAGRPILGTCAGLIVCDDEHLGFIDADAPSATPSAVSCRASRPTSRSRGSARSRCGRSSSGRPGCERHGPGVEVLASHEGHPVAVREERVLACAFHPELTDDPRLHALFMAMATKARASDARARGGESS